MTQHRLRTTRLLLLGGVGLMILTGFAGLREDELECEEAVGHLQNCCIGFHVPSDYCRYKSGPGCGEATYPALTVEDSRCIQDSDCAKLADEYLCQEAAGREPIFDGAGSATDSPSEPLCE